MNEIELIRHPLVIPRNGALEAIRMRTKSPAQGA
jgi:hypothetical protein